MTVRSASVTDAKPRRTNSLAMNWSTRARASDRVPGQAPAARRPSASNVSRQRSAHSSPREDARSSRNDCLRTGELRRLDIPQRGGRAVACRPRENSPGECSEDGDWPPTNDLPTLLSPTRSGSLQKSDLQSDWPEDRIVVCQNLDSMPPTHALSLWFARNSAPSTWPKPLSLVASTPGPSQGTGCLVRGLACRQRINDASHSLQLGLTGRMAGSAQPPSGRPGCEPVHRLN
jgi:hypothetical protein